MLGQLLHHRLHQRGQRQGVLQPGLGVHHPDLHGAEVRMRAHVVPEVGVVLDHAAGLHELDPLRPVLEVVVARRDAHAREGAEDRRAGGEQAGVVGPPERRVGRQRQQQRQVHPHPVGHVDGLVGVVDPHVHVDAEDQLLARHELQAGDQVPVARAGDDPLVLPHRERVGAGRADGQAALVRHRLHRAAKLCELAARLGRVVARCGGDLADRLHQLGLHIALGVRVGQIRRAGPRSSWSDRGSPGPRSSAPPRSRGCSWGP